MLHEIEKDAVAEAYRRQVMKLFDEYEYRCTPGDDAHLKEHLARFKRDIEALRRTYIHALSVFSESKTV